MKPTGLAASLLVTLCYHQDELEKALKGAFEKCASCIANKERLRNPRCSWKSLVEGEMYSIDSYVTTRGKVYHCPIVHIKTGRSVGYDDFFGYVRITPTQLSKTSIQAAQVVATKTVRALGLRILPRTRNLCAQRMAGK